MSVNVPCAALGERLDPEDDRAAVGAPRASAARSATMTTSEMGLAFMLQTPSISCADSAWANARAIDDARPVRAGRLYSERLLSPPGASGPRIPIASAQPTQ